MIKISNIAFFFFLLSEVVFAQKFTSASSLWLTYQNSVDSADIISIDFEIDSTALYTYYAGLVWNNGYAGVQRAGAGFFKHVHFSLWDPEGMTSSVVWHDFDVRVERFGGEGTGWKAMWNFHWKEHKTYRMLVKLTDEGDRTNYDAWFFNFEKYRWKHIATFQYPIKKYFDYLMSFIEDFGSTVENYRAYSLFNAYQRNVRDSSWRSFPFAEYYINGNNPNCNGSVVDNKFKLETGGAINPTNPSGTILMTMPDEFVVSAPEINKIFVEPNLSDETLTIYWNYVDNLWAPQASYGIKISDDSLFSNILLESGVQNLSDTSYTAVNFIVDTTKTYFLKVNVKSIYDKTDEKICSFRNNILTDVAENNAYPNKYWLSQNYPNPFNPTTTISYIIARSKAMRNSPLANGTVEVSLKVFDILGREVATLVNKKQTPGKYSVQFNASSVSGVLPSGVYFYNLRAADKTITKKMIYLR